ncbi:MAG: SacI restriction endonuclease [Lentisphaerae bacterium ADurb.BinA184]|nr:MAG: SacI restriction endonuclease [Lentisphaerae bacterium ADurb.BinA184]
MPRSVRETQALDLAKAKAILLDEWARVVSDAMAQPDLVYVPDPVLRDAIAASVNHRQVAYRFCLPVQLLGKLTDPALDCLCLQKRHEAGEQVSGWDARSLGSKVLAPFNHDQEDILGSSSDPYVGNPMRIPRMRRGDESKKDVAGWDTLVRVLEDVEARRDAAFTLTLFRQVLLVMYRRQQSLRFVYPVPPRVSLETVTALAAAFLGERSGGDRALALCGALFDAIGEHFGLYARVSRARINASDEAVGLAADLECLDRDGRVVLAVEVKDRRLTLDDVEGTIKKARRREVRDIFFAAPGTTDDDRQTLDDRIGRAFAGGQNVYVFDLVEFGRGVWALGGESLRRTFLVKVGEHLDTWNTQPAHRQAWRRLLESA